MTITWTNVETAIQHWVVNASGLAPDHVIWAMQSGPRPSSPFITLHMMSLRKVGQDWVETVTSDAGTTYSWRARGVRQVVLSIQCFGAAAVGSAGAVQILNDVILASKLPPNQDALGAAAIGFMKFGNVMSLNAVINSTTFEPRGQVEARFFLGQEITIADGSIIEHAEIEGKDEHDDVLIPEFTVSV